MNHSEDNLGRLAIAHNQRLQLVDCDGDPRVANVCPEEAVYEWPEHDLVEGLGCRA